MSDRKIEEIKKTWNGNEKAYLKDVTEIAYSWGGTGRGFTTITATRKDFGALLDVIPFPDTDEFIDPKKITSEQWETLLDELFSKLQIQKWDDTYIAHDVYGGTQWEVVIRLSNGLWYKNTGSNAYPENWDAFKAAMMGIWRQGTRA